jgi:hypothetical protein
VLEDAEEWCVEEEAFVRKLRGYMADDLETKGVQNCQGQEHNIGLQFGKKRDLKNTKFRKRLHTAHQHQWA